jgi:hypothetical protein
MLVSYNFMVQSRFCAAVVSLVGMQCIELKFYT